jgi:hypothetical protein
MMLATSSESSQMKGRRVAREGDRLGKAKRVAHEPQLRTCLTWALVRRASRFRHLHCENWNHEDFLADLWRYMDKSIGRQRDFITGQRGTRKTPEELPVPTMSRLRYRDEFRQCRSMGSPCIHPQIAMTGNVSHMFESLRTGPAAPGFPTAPREVVLIGPNSRPRRCLSASTPEGRGHPTATENWGCARGRGNRMKSCGVPGFAG